MFGRLVLLTLAAPLMVCAADLKTKSGKIYKDYEITGANAGGIVIFHESGTATIAPADWPDALKNEIAGYMADHQRIANTAAEQKNKADAERLLNQNSNLISGKVISVLKDGVLVVEWLWVQDVYNDKNSGLSDKERIQQMLDGADLRVRSLYANILKEKQKKHGNRTINGASVAEGSTMKPFIDAVRRLNILKSNDLCFIEMDTTGITNNSRILGYYYPIGTYRYTAVNGAANTVLRYTVDHKTALEYLKNRK